MGGFSTYYQMKAFGCDCSRSPDWLKVTPSPGLGLWLSTDEAQVLFKWLLGLPLFEDGATCPLCGPQEPLDKLGHHATTCKRGPHVCCHHNQNVLWGIIFEFFSQALLSPELEKGSGMDHSHSQSHPADILVPLWSIGKPKLDSGRSELNCMWVTRQRNGSCQNDQEWP